MKATNPHNPLHQGCLCHLQHILELAMHTADAASADGNHKVVIQAIREVTRIVTLMIKIDVTSKPEMGAMPLNSAAGTGLDSLRDPKPAMTLDAGIGILPENPGPYLKTKNRKPKTRNQQLETRNSELETPVAASGQPQPRWLEQLAGQWEKSGKLPEKISLMEGIAEENKVDNRCEEISGKYSKSCSLGSQHDARS
jgi:hypothetical protein